MMQLMKKQRLESLVDSYLDVGLTLVRKPLGEIVYAVRWGPSNAQFLWKSPMPNAQFLS